MELLKGAAQALGESVNEFILRAVEGRIEAEVVVEEK